MEIKNCPVCDSVELDRLYPEHILDKDGQSIKNTGLVYHKCKNCDIEFTPSPGYGELKKTYEEEYRPKIGLVRMLKWMVPYSKHYKSKLKFLEPFLAGKKGRALDIGCANGKFLFLLKLKGWNVVGIEPTKQYADFASRIFRIRTFNGLFEDFETEDKFDLVTIMVVLEHMKDPEQVLRRVNGMLNKGGYLFITVPSGIYCPEHLFLFSEKSISFLLEKTGFKIEKVKTIVRADGSVIFVLSQKK